jgi:serine beta-lactamase-like protein LACTB, mitochondrial
VSGERRREHFLAVCSLPFVRDGKKYQNRCFAWDADMKTTGYAKFAGLIALLHAAGGDVATAQSLDAATQASRAVVERFMSTSRTPGLSVAVQVNDSLVWVDSFGLADVEHGVPITPATLFRIGSISKALTSAAVGLLHQRRLLDLDAPIQTYVPSFPNKDHAITTRHLGGHLSGLPHYAAEDFANFIPYESVLEALDKFKDRPLLFRPCERFGYSSFGFNLISAAVEAVADTPFLVFMAKEVFERLGMRNTVPDEYRRIVPHRTGFYELNESGELGNAPFTDNSDVWAGGGLLSTPADLVTFGHGLLRGDLLTPETLEILFTSMKTVNGEATGYGLGWAVWKDDVCERIIGHGGSHFGATAMLWMCPSRQLIVAITTNLSGAQLSTPVDEIVRNFVPLTTVSTSK